MRYLQITEYSKRVGLRSTVTLIAHLASGERDGQA